MMSQEESIRKPDIWLLRLTRALPGPWYVSSIIFFVLVYLLGCTVSMVTGEQEILIDPVARLITHQPLAKMSGPDFVAFVTHNLFLIGGSASLWLANYFFRAHYQVISRIRPAVDLDDTQYRHVWEKYYRMVLNDKRLASISLPTISIFIIVFLELLQSYTPSWSFFLLIYVALLVTMGGAFFGSYLYLAFSLAWVVHDLGKKPLQKRFIDPDRAAGLKPVAEFALRIAVSWFFLMTLTLVPVIWLIYIGSPLFSICIFSAPLAGGLALFFLPQFTFHQRMAERRRERVEEISDRLNTLYFQYVQGKDDKVKAEMLFLRDMLSEAEKMKEWPFDSKIIAQLIGSLTVPILSVTIRVILLL